MRKIVLRRSAFLSTIGSLSLTACAGSSLLPNSKASGAIAGLLDSANRESYSTLMFPALRPDGTRPVLHRGPEPFVRQLHTVRSSMRPDSIPTSSTWGKYTTYGYQSQHYYETYYNGTLVVQLYLSPATTKGLPMKVVTKKKTVTGYAPNKLGKLPYNFGYCTLSKIKPGHYELTRNSDKTILMKLNLTVSPAVATFLPPGGFKLTCAGAYAIAFAAIAAEAASLEASAEVECLGVQGCIVMVMAATQASEDSYDQYWADWAKNYCADHPSDFVRLRHHAASGSNSCDYAGSSTGSSGTVDGYGGTYGSSGGTGGTGGSGGGSCGSEVCTEGQPRPFQRFYPPDRKI